MDITTGTPEWDEVVDRDAWRTFLRSTAGQRLFAKALDSQPGLLASGDVNAILIRSGEVRGWSAVISTLISLSSIESKPTDTAAPENYPDLTDDDAWKSKEPTK